MTGLERFVAIYREKLRIAVREFPTEYRFGDDGVDRVVEAVRHELEYRRHSYAMDGRAFKATCKELGLKLARKDINAFNDAETAS